MLNEGKKDIGIAILGFGTVGSGVAQILETSSGAIREKSGYGLSVKKILDVRDFSSHPLSALFVSDINAVLADDDIAVVVEAIGGTDPAFAFNSSCLKAGKSVVTSNKELVATYGAELMELAKQNGVHFLFEAAVGGATPIIAPMLSTLAAGEIQKIAGILNGTTNFILTRMICDGVSYEEALSVAQDLGYAETGDPSDDVDGIDPKRKIAILASIAFGIHIPPDKVEAKGIREVTYQDLTAAQQMGGTIKLIAHAEKLAGDVVSVGVAPMFVAAENRMYTVNDVYNAAWFTCEYAGDVVTYGRGAGKLPTAGAILGDVLTAIQTSADRPVLWKAYDMQLKITNECGGRYFVADGEKPYFTGKLDQDAAKELLGSGVKAYKILE